MKLYNKYMPLMVALLACSMSGCIDNDYDLSDIDTTAKVDINDLVIPINIDPIQLQTVIHLNDDSKIKLIDGKYAVVVDGDFSSDDIVVSPVNVAAPNISPVSASVPNYMTNNLGSNSFVIFNPLLASFNYENNNVSPNIISMEHVGTDWTIQLQITVDEGGSIVNKYELQDLVLQLPKGLEGQPDAGTYDPVTGYVTISNIVSTGKTVTINMPVTGVDIAKSDLQYTYSTHTIKLADQIGIQSGIIEATDMSTTDIQANIGIKIKPTLSAINIKSFTGSFSYDIQGFNIPQVNLNDLPSIFTQSGTNINIVNPQLYLAVNNPLSQYGVSAKSGFELKPIHNGLISGTYSPDNGYISIGTNGANGTYDLVLAPSKPSSYYSGYNSADFQKFTSLSYLLQGDGLPTAINVDMVNPRIETTHVTDFTLGNIGTVNGRYTFYAPLQFGDGSYIVYTGTESGWTSEDLEGLTITQMTITADVTNNLPVDVYFEVHPLDSNGNEMAVNITGAQINSNSEQQLDIVLSGTIQDLDGIKYVANVFAQNSEQLAPDLQISVKNVKATISGYYLREL